MAARPCMRSRMRGCLSAAGAIQHGSSSASGGLHGLYIKHFKVECARCDVLLCWLRMTTYYKCKLVQQEKPTSPLTENCALL